MLTLCKGAKRGYKDVSLCCLSNPSISDSKLRKEYFNSHVKGCFCFIFSLGLKCNSLGFKSSLLPAPIGMEYSKTVYPTKNLIIVGQKMVLTILTFSCLYVYRKSPGRPLT